jgi:hypothetical protein
MSIRVCPLIIRDVLARKIKPPTLLAGADEVIE